MSIFIFGEVLWDVYPEKKTLGGAPFNFAAHLKRLGNDVGFITAMGKDALGDETAEIIASYGVDNTFINRISQPTGVCNVSISDDGIPTYDLCPGMAYDNIELTDEQKKLIEANESRTLYFGTLAQREAVSRSTLKALTENYKWNDIFFDINIRQHYYSKEIAEHGLTACTVLKISREELPVLSELGICLLSQKDFQDEGEYYTAVCKHLSDAYNIETILLTLDKDGAMSYKISTDTAMFSQKPEGKVVSTVGAGDSFFAAYINAYLKNKAPEECLKQAVILSSFVVQNLESIPEYTDDIQNKLS